MVEGIKGKTPPESASSIYPRRTLLKYAVIVSLVLFSPIVYIVRLFWRNRGTYKWVDQPGKQIPIPKEIQGQLGFKAAVSLDGQVIVAAGNPVMPAHLLSESIRSDPNGEYQLLLALRSQIFVAESPFTYFRHLWSNLNTSFVTALAVCPVSNNRVAALVYEFPFEHPDSYEDAIRIADSDPKKRSREAEELKKVSKRGYEGNLYLMDTHTGTHKKLANLFSGRQVSRHGGFAALLNERALVWDSTGSLLYSHDERCVFSIDMSGQRKSIFELKNSIVFSSIDCDSDGNLSMLTIEKGDGKFNIYNGMSFLIQIAPNGSVLKKEECLRPPGYEYEENNIIFVGKDVLLFPSLVKSSKDSKFWKVPKENLKSNQSVLFHDPNDVQFYYAVYGMLPDTHEVLFAKKRMLTGGTPYDFANMEAPWVELRRFPLSQM